MDALGWFTLLGWIPSAGFLAIHTRSMITAHQRTVAGWVTLVMGIVIFIVMTMAMIRNSLDILLPDWIRELAFGLVMIGLWGKFLGIIWVRYVGDRDRARAALGLDDRDDERETAHSPAR